METRASYALVGGFVLALAAALFVTVIWLAKVSFDTVAQPYRIYFTGSVTGLVEGSPVRYRGIAVGTVTDLRIDPENVERIQVTIEVPTDTPIRADAMASLEPVGITGGVYIEIQGGSQSAQPLVDVQPGIPVIPSRQSAIAELLTEAPKLLQNLIKLSDGVAGFVTPENQKAVGAILSNLASTTQAADATVRNADRLFIDLRKDINGLTQAAETLIANADHTVVTVGQNTTQISGEMARTAEELRLLVQSLVKTSDEMGALIAENREPIHDFTSTGLYDFSLLAAELRDLAANLTRVTTRIENDPTKFLFGGRQTGVDVK